MKKKGKDKKGKAPAKPKRTTGGRRTTEAIHAARVVARGGDYESARAARYAQLVGPAPYQDPTAAFSWLARKLMFDLEEASSDPGLPPEARREQTARLAPQLVKALDPARLADELREFKRALDEMKGATDAGANIAGDSSRAQGSAPLQ